MPRTLIECKASARSYTLGTGNHQPKHSSNDKWAKKAPVYNRLIIAWPEVTGTRASHAFDREPMQCEVTDGGSGKRANAMRTIHDIALKDNDRRAIERAAKLLKEQFPVERDGALA